MVVTLVENDKLYFRETYAAIVIKNMDGVPIWSFDPFNMSGVDFQPIFYQVQRSLRHNGIFELQLEDENYAIDQNQMSRINRIEISIGKKSSNMSAYFYGWTRGFGHHAGFKGKVLYNLFGYGFGQRFNERVLDYNKGPPTLQVNSQEIDQSDTNFQADKLLQNCFEDYNVYPPDVKVGQAEGSLGYGWVEANGLTSRSQEQYFIPSIVVRFGTINDVVTLIEQYTGAKAWVNTSGDLQFNALLVSPTGNKGFVFKNQKTLNTDDADYTGYLTSGVFDSLRNYTLESGFTNHVYGILAEDSIPPTDDASSLSNFKNNWSNEIAVPFRVPTAPNWRVYLALRLNDGNADSNVPKTRIRMCQDNNPTGALPTTIKNVGGVLDSDDLTQQEYDFSNHGVEVLIGMEGNSLFPSTNWMWLILSSVNATSTEFFEWAHDNGSNGILALAPNGTSSSSDGGSAWTYSIGPQMRFYLIRVKSQAQAWSDDKSVRKQRQLIDTTFNLPIVVSNALGAARYMVGAGRYQSRPRPTYDITIRPPNKPIFEGDVGTLIHDDLRLSAGRTPAVFGTIGDVTYTAGVKDGGANDPIQLGMKKMQLTLLGYPTRY